MLWQGKIDFERPITLKGKPHGIDQFETMPEWNISFDGQIFYVASEKKVYVGTNTGFVELSPSGTTHDHNYLYYTKTEINTKFDTGSGHDHDGINSKKVLYSNLSGIPDEFNPSIHDNSHHSVNYITAGEISFNILNNNSIVGTGSNQIAKGDHLHDNRYFTESELSASTGASLIGVSNILNQTTVQDAFNALLLQFNNYRLISDSYTKSEINLGFVSTSGSQEILGTKTFNDIITFKSSINIEDDIIPTTEINIGNSTNNFSRVYTRSLALDGEIYYKSDIIKASNLYTKTDLQTSGNSQIHWDNLISVPADFPPSTHTHNDLYYTKTESDGKYSLSNHDHNNIYYTKTESDTLYATHTHFKSSITDFLESDYVHTSGNETITGNKNFENIFTTSFTTRQILLDIQNNEYPGIISINDSNASILKYDVITNNYKIDQFLIDNETQILLSSSIIATRNDTMTNNSIPIWNDTTKRFDSSSITISDNEINAVNLTLSGNLTVNGTTTTIDTTNLLIEDNLITLNKNQTGIPPTNLLSGIEVERGDSDNYQFLFRESDDAFVIGESASLQAVATREDAPVANAIPFWNDVAKRFDSSGVTVSGSTLTGTLSGNASSATKLATARTINGVNFDGTTNITITASTTAPLVQGTGLVGGDFNGSSSKTWSVAFGTTAGTACEGNDSRLSDARDPKSHALVGSDHTVSGLTEGHFLKATGATTYEFTAITSAEISDKVTGVLDTSAKVPTSAAVKTYVDARGFIPAYGMMYETTARTYTGSSQNIIFTSFANLSGVTQETNSLVIQTEGIYEIVCNLSVAFSTSDTDYTFSVTNNNVKIPYIKYNINSNSIARYLAISISGIVNLASSDFIKVLYESSIANSEVSIKHANLYLKRIA